MTFRGRVWSGWFWALAAGWPLSASAGGPPGAPAGPGSAPAPPSAASPAGAAGAAEAYDQGVELYRQKRFGEAARAFARADELSPHPVAVRQALEASLLADDPALAMAMAERLEAREGAGGESAGLVARARARHAERAGKFVVRCPAGATCRALVDGEPVGPPRDGWALAGAHTVHVAAGDSGRLEPRTVQLNGGQTFELAPVAASEPARAAPAPRAVERGVLGPGWFWGGVALTGALGVASLWSGLDTASRHERFRRDRAAGAAGAGQADEGRGAQARTNVLGGATIAAGLATAALGAFAVRWRPRGAAVAVGAGGGAGPWVALSSEF